MLQQDRVLRMSWDTPIACLLAEHYPFELVPQIRSVRTANGIANGLQVNRSRVAPVPDSLYFGETCLKEARSCPRLHA